MKKVIWAVDPFQRNSDASRSALASIRAMSKTNPWKIQPVFIWGASAPEVYPDLPEWSYEAIRSEANARVQAIAKRTQLEGVLPIHIPSSPSLGISDGVRRLVAYAKKQRADLIIVSTHGRKGLSRFVLGSFAETLILHSDIPVFSVHPAWGSAGDRARNRAAKGATALKTLLFPTDFSYTSKKAFTDVLALAKAQGASITIFHKVVMPAYPAYEFAFTAYQAYAETFEDEAKHARIKAKKWATLARARGVTAHIEIDSTRRGGATETIIKRAQQMGAVIAMAAQSSPLRVHLLGSTTRQVIRNSTQPVWVVRP
jgi:nucleotide-binding universal stress UspA family protein